MSGVCTVLERVLGENREAATTLDGVMIGTTHFVNVVVQRRSLNRVAALRIGLPSGRSLPPFVDWPENFSTFVSGSVDMVRGGQEDHDRLLVPLDKQAVREAACRVREAGVGSVGICGVFSPLTTECELENAVIAV